jgi:putative drug exporter of the RND superfamily
VFVFGSVVAAALPIVMCVMAVAVTSGVLAIITVQVDISVLALNLTTMLGLGLGIDYSLLIVSRFREELHPEAVEQSVIRQQFQIQILTRGPIELEDKDSVA